MSPLLWGLAVVVKVSLLWGAGLAATHLLRRRGAATRHAVWTATLFGVLAVPLLGAVLPGWRAPVPGLASTFTPSQAAESMAPAPAANEPSHLSLLTSPAVSNASSVSETKYLTVAVLVLWGAGALAVLALVLSGQLEMLRAVRRARNLEGTWRKEASEAAGLMGVRRAIRILQAPDIPVPATWGAWRSIVLLPPDAEQWSAGRRRVVLLHELAHVARFDCLVEYVAWIACALYWFHPGVWHIARRVRAERERACDDLVIGAGTPAAEYAMHLVDVAAGIAPPRRRPLAALAMAGRGTLESRLADLLDPDRIRGRLSLASRVGLVAVALALVSGIAAARPAPTQAERVELPIAPDATVRWDGPVVRGDTVSVRAAMGSITVDTTPEATVRVTALRRVGPRGRDAETRVDVYRRGRTWVICSVHLSGGRAVSPCEVNDDWGRGSVDDNDVSFRVTVPVGVHLNLMTGLGDVTVKVTEGDVTALTGNGILDLASYGPASLNAYSGQIRYTMLDALRDARVRLRVKHGAINIRFGPKANVAYDLQPGRGTVQVDLPASRVRGIGKRIQGSLGSGLRHLIASLEKGDITVGITPQ